MQTKSGPCPPWKNQVQTLYWEKQDIGVCEIIWKKILNITSAGASAPSISIEAIKKALREGGMDLLEILDADTMTTVLEETERIYVIAREVGKKRG